MHRIHVEKKPAFAAAARHLLRDLRESLGIESLVGVRTLQRYDVDGLTDDQFADAVRQVLSEPRIDTTHVAVAPGPSEHVFAIEYLPGQFDQRADSAAQCIEILTGERRPSVRAGTVVVLEGDLDVADIDRIKSYLINAVDSHEASLEVPDTLHPPAPTPGDVAVLDGFTDADPESLRRAHGLAMSADDVSFCQRYFAREERRDPTITELTVLDTYWSDHCRHTTFLTELTDVDFAEGTEPIERAWRTYRSVRADLGRDDRPVTLMDIALVAMRELRASGELTDVEESDEINAASIVVPVDVVVDGVTRTEEWLVMFKNETHNHPTEIEPFGGAATCIGGCIRDPLSGRSFVYQAMRVTGAGDPRTPVADTLPGKLPQRKICREAAAGYSSYGNQIGLATGQVAEIYHPGYVAKRLEIGAVVAAAPRTNVYRGSPAPGDRILLIGGRTGRDGVGGATGSSKEHTDAALESSAEVQKGDAPTERKIQRLFRDPELARRIKVCNDFGAGGVSVAIGEIAPSLDIDLDAVPKKYVGLDGTEIAISESQERMAVCIDPSDEAFVVAASDAENLECTCVAVVADHGRLRMTWRGRTIVDVSRAFLDTNGVSQAAAISVPAPAPLPEGPERRSLLDHLAALEHCGQKGLGELFDGSVGAATVLWPFGGERQLTPPEAMVAKLPLLVGETDAATYMAWAFDPELSSASPFHGAAWAVTESVCKCVAAGASASAVRLTLQEYFPKLGDDPVRWAQPFAALLGAFDAQHGLRLAAIGGKDSMSGSFNELDVPPTLVSFALAPGLASRATSPEFGAPGRLVSLLEVAPTGDGLPDYPAVLAVTAALHDAIGAGAVSAVKAVGRSGLAHAIAVSAMGNDVGFRSYADLPDDGWYRRRGAAFVVEHAAPLPDALTPFATAIGETTAEPTLVVGKEVHSLDDVRAAWLGTLEPVYPTVAEPDDDTTDEPIPVIDPMAHGRPHRPTRPGPRPARPRVIIPAFPGTNSEYDSARAFAEAGADPDIVVFTNLTPGHIADSTAALAAAIDGSQILFVPGGFSAGDEPDGAAKFIAAVLRSGAVSDAVMRLLRDRDGLVLGICNGFQALVRTGLVVHGEFREPDADAPTLFHNRIGRHVSSYVHTRVSSVSSPWLAHCRPGQVHRLPVSHGEGRFVAAPEVVATLVANGQVATQYSDAAGTPSMDVAHNPNGSTAAIEGLTSPCGKVFGKMAHSERRGADVARNIPGDKAQPLFSAGVAWFD